MSEEFKKWIDDNCQNTPTKQKLEFYKIDSDKAFLTVYLKNDFQGYLTDDIDEFLDEDTDEGTLWYVSGNDLEISNDKIMVSIIDTPITNSPLF